MANQYNEWLQQRGLRVTPQRVMVLEAIREGSGHMTAEEVYKRVCERYPYVNLATIYRTLELFKDLGLLTVIDVGEKSVQYELLSAEPHHHLICEHCGLVADLDDSLMLSVRERLANEFGFQARVEHVAIFGHCQNCRHDSPHPAAAPSA